MARFSLFLTVALIISAASTGIYWFTKKTARAATIQISMESLKSKKNIVPVAVMGSGPAGLSAALYAARAALYTVVFQGEKPGGLLTTTTYVENWPGTKRMLGTELIDQSRKQAEKFGAFMLNSTIKKVDFSTWPFKLVTDDGQEINALTVIVATGALPKLLHVPGEAEFMGKGVTTCAVCDAPYFKDKKVIVIGGGDSAVEQATFLASYAKEVIMLVRGTTMRAAPAMKQRIAQFPKVTVIYNTEVTKIMGDSSPVDHVTGVELQDRATHTRRLLSVDGVFLAIGHEPVSALFKDYLTLTKDNYIALRPRTQETSIPGVQAAGDVADNRYRQAGAAAGDGIKAALDAVMFLQEHDFTEARAKELEKNYYEPQEHQAGVMLTKLVNEKDFEKISRSSEPIIIDVGAEYCTACRSLLPLMESAAARFKDKAHFAQIDLGTNPKELVKRLGITGSIPQVLAVKNGKVIKRYDHPSLTRHGIYTMVNEIVATEE